MSRAGYRKWSPVCAKAGAMDNIHGQQDGYLVEARAKGSRGVSSGIELLLDPHIERCLGASSY